VANSEAWRRQLAEQIHPSGPPAGEPGRVPWNQRNAGLPVRPAIFADDPPPAPAARSGRRLAAIAGIGAALVGAALAGWVMRPVLDPQPPRLAPSGGGQPMPAVPPSATVAVTAAKPAPAPPVEPVVAPAPDKPARPAAKAAPARPAVAKPNIVIAEAVPPGRGTHPAPAVARTRTTPPPGEAKRATAAAARPSFSCRRSRSDVSRMICGDRELAALDQAVSRAFHGLAGRADPQLARRIDRDQAAFLNERSQCASPECVRHVYRERLHELGAESGN
jgi:uncharacterized protein YecT (DUF1311 family)